MKICDNGGSSIILVLAGHCPLSRKLVTNDVSGEVLLPSSGLPPVPTSGNPVGKPGGDPCSGIVLRRTDSY